MRLRDVRPKFWFWLYHFALDRYMDADGRRDSKDYSDGKLTYK